MDVMTTGNSAPRNPYTDGGADFGWGALRIWAIGSLVGNMGLILTGALVRLTKSGLGCPTWPKCTSESFIPVDQGLHGAIEFGNRLLTFVLAALAIGTFIAAMRLRDRGLPRPDLRRLSFIAGVGVPLQAVIGGISVLTKLNPYVVGLHLIVSVAMIVILVLLVRRSQRWEPQAVNANGHLWVRISFALVMLSVVLGVLVTGSAPHAGDDQAIRNGLDIETIAKIHAWTVWGLMIALVIAWWFTRARQVVWLIIAALLQGLVGYLQYFNGLPIWIIALHMIGVAVISAVAGNMLFALDRRPSAPMDAARDGIVT